MGIKIQKKGIFHKKYLKNRRKMLNKSEYSRYNINAIPCLGNFEDLQLNKNRQK
jgi:hypothetical protein